MVIVVITYSPMIFVLVPQAAGDRRSGTGEGASLWREGGRRGGVRRRRCAAAGGRPGRVGIGPADPGLDLQHHGAGRGEVVQLDQHGERLPHVPAEQGLGLVGRGGMPAPDQLAGSRLEHRGGLLDRDVEGQGEAEWFGHGAVLSVAWSGSREAARSSPLRHSLSLSRADPRDRRTLTGRVSSRWARRRIRISSASEQVPRTTMSTQWPAPADMAVAQAVVGRGIKALVGLAQPHPRGQEEDARAQIAAEQALVGARRLRTAADRAPADLAEGLRKARRLRRRPGGERVPAAPRGVRRVDPPGSRSRAAACRGSSDRLGTGRPATAPGSPGARRSGARTGARAPGASRRPAAAGSRPAGAPIARCGRTISSSTPSWRSAITGANRGRAACSRTCLWR